MTIESLNAVDTQCTAENHCVLKSACVADLTPVEAVDSKSYCLPSAEDYCKQDRTYVQDYWELQSRKWSEPKYRCPVCSEGGMRRDETVVLTSNSPSYRYECDKCHHIAYHHI